MWAKFRSTMIKKDKKEMKESDHERSLNVNNEYLFAFRTESYVDLFMKSQSLLNHHTTSSPAHDRHCRISSQDLLDPTQEAITAVLESSSSIFSNKSYYDHKSLLLNYFHVSAEASRFCSQILRSLSRVQSDYRSIHQVLNSIDDDEDQEFDQTRVISEFLNLNDLLFDTKKQDFIIIHEKHSRVLQQLKSMRRKVARKMKMIKFLNRASRVFLVGPTLPLNRRSVRNNNGVLRYGFLRKLARQLDLAAKGTYIVDRDFDTTSRLVDRLQGDIERHETMIGLWWERREDRVWYHVLKEIKKSELGFLKQMEELEEHVYLCLLTINRGRKMVIKELSTHVY